MRRTLPRRPHQEHQGKRALQAYVAGRELFEGVDELEKTAGIWNRGNHYADKPSAMSTRQMPRRAAVETREHTNWLTGTTVVTNKRFLEERVRLIDDAIRRTREVMRQPAAR